MKTNNAKILSIALFVISLGLGYLVKELLSREAISPLVALVLIIVIIGFYYGARHIIYKKCPSLAPQKDKIEETDFSHTDDMVETPRTVMSTIIEIAVAAMFALSFYKAWTNDRIGLLIVSILAVGAVGMLILAYYPNSREGEVNPKATAADFVKSRRMRVRSVALALFSLAFCFLPHTHLALIGCGLYIAIRLIFSFILKGVPELHDKNSRFNIAEVKVTHTPVALAVEAVTILILIGAWAVAHYTHQMEGIGLLDFPIIEMVCYSVLAVVALIIPYCPRWMNRSEGFVNNRQLLENIKLYRILAIGMSIAVLVTLYLPYKGTYSIMDTISRNLYIFILFADLYMRNRVRNELKKANTAQ
jgi:hypothetical protein